jgi:hypothetical protein
MADFAKENLICVYRQNDSDSYAFALRYKNIYDLDDDQIVAIPCSNVEIVADYLTFMAEVESPISVALSSGTLANRSVYGIVLMPYVPGGFYDNGNIVSSTSRLSRMKSSYSRNTQNPIYNRQIFKRFDESDALSHMICSRIDGPNSVVEKWFENIENTNFRLLATGDFFLDSYSAYTYDGSSDYESELKTFGQDYLNRLGVGMQLTTRIKATKDPFFPSLTNDSFYWGWGADRGSTSFFKTTPHLRGFFYNADKDGALTVRNITGRTWPLLAIRSGYVATAGSMKADDAKEYLRPTPFMDALYRGATLGEAFIFSQPYLDSSVCCLGDPLQVFQFPTPLDTNTLVPLNQSWQNMEDYLAKAVISDYRRSNVIKNLRNKIANGTDEQVQVDLLYPFNDLYNKYNDRSWRSDFYLVTKDFFNYATGLNRKQYDITYNSISDYLSYTGNKVSDIILETLPDANWVNQIDAANIKTIGSWDFVTELEHYYGEFRFYNIELEVAQFYDDFDLGQQIFIKKTFDDTTNWYYEDLDGNYQPFSSNGITSNYVGRKIKYASQSTELLSRGEYYWFRVRQIDELQTFDWRYYQMIIYH